MNKGTEVMEHISDSDPDAIFITETWMPNDTNDITAKIKSYGYNLLHNRRKNRDKTIGGGVGIMVKDNIICKQVSSKQYSSFEHTIVTAKTKSNSKITLVTIYRLLFISTALFLEELTMLLETFSASDETFILAGDVNIHLDDKNDIHTKQFNDIMEMFNLVQHVNFATHKLGHTIDIVVTQADSPVIENIKASNVDLSDHYMILFDSKTIRLDQKEYVTLNYRNTKAVDNEQFCADIKQCWDSVKSNNLGEKITIFNDLTDKVVNTHAPQKTKQVKLIPHAPWFDAEYKEARRRRRKAEKEYKRSGLEHHKNAFINVRKETTTLAFNKKRDYFATKIDQSNGNSKVLFNCLNTLVDSKKEAVLPSHDSPLELAEKFKIYFRDKIKNIRESFTLTIEEDSQKIYFSGNSPLASFHPTTEEEIRSIIKTYGVNCSPEDPIPIMLLKNNIDFFLPIWMDLVNLSLSQGSMECLKNAILNPLIKELDQLIDKDILKNYRPVSNLLFLSKLIERVVAIRLDNHMIINNLHSEEQYGYKKGHSTEMLLVKMVNDLLLACDNKMPTVLMLLDLSAAFDTVDQPKLLNILQSEIGITNIAYKWFESFLRFRTQKVKIRNSYSSEDILQYGVPQGSVLGPVLFNIYIRSFYTQVQSAGFDVEGFADDHQLKRTFSPVFQVSSLGDKIQGCFGTITKWMNEYFLQLNPDKTRILVVCPPTLQKSISIKGTFINGKCVRFVSNAKNLGVILDNELSLEAHVKKVTASCFNTIRKIARIKNFLKQEHLKTLVSALVLSRIDYCNALYLGINSELLMKLQSVQNAAVRLVCKVNHYERLSVTSLTKDLHWLKVKERVTFKVLLIIHKVLIEAAPPAFKPMFKRVASERTKKLEIRTCNGKFGNRAITVNAPKLWNALPFTIRDELDTPVFKKKLKTFLFSYADTLYHQASMK